MTKNERRQIKPKRAIPMTEVKNSPKSNRPENPKIYRVAVKYKEMDNIILLENKFAESFIDAFKRVDSNYIPVMFNDDSQMILRRELISIVKIDHDDRTNDEYLEDVKNALR